MLNTKKICIIVIDINNNIPKWLDIFLLSCSKNISIDWLLFTNYKIEVNKFKNIDHVYIDSNIFQKLVKSEIGITPDFTHTDGYYKLCDFRPTYGILFEKYIKKYDYWGHCDTDQIFGNIINNLDVKNILNYDIISSRKKVTSGHFTLYKNNNRINTLFTKCKKWRYILTQPDLHAFDEKGFPKLRGGITRVIKQENINVLWDQNRFNYPGYIIRSRKRNYNKDPGTLSADDKWLLSTNKIEYIGDDNLFQLKNPLEVMYLHFQNWKRASMFTDNIDIKNRDMSQARIITSKGII